MPIDVGTGAHGKRGPHNPTMPPPRSAVQGRRLPDRDRAATPTGWLRSPPIRPMVAIQSSVTEGADMMPRLHPETGDAHPPGQTAATRRRPQASSLPGWRPLLAAIGVVFVLAIVLHLLYR